MKTPTRTRARFHATTAVVVAGFAGVGISGATTLEPDPLSNPQARGAAAVTVDADTVDFAIQVAPILYANCTGCHNPGGVAPFSLRTYEEAHEHAGRIARATSAGVMPPWPPQSDGATFVGERHLTTGEVEILNAWADAGAPPGNLDAAPPLPPISSGWWRGEPDLVIRMPTYTLRAEGRDVYRNLVLDIPIDSRRYVESLELRPGDPRVVHHARMMIDTTDSSQTLDAQDDEPGFDGMEMRSNASNPDGHFLGWTPGKGALPPMEGMAWTLDPGDQLVLQLHMRTTGRPEQVESEVGFYFAESPPTRHPVLLFLSSLMIDIPPGDPAYRVTNSYVLPVGVDLLSVSPHAHYLGKDLRGYATLPNGSEKELIRVPNWDFNWQEEYRFKDPLRLPAGTRLTLDYVFDNSTANPNNPNDPPRRVVYGSNSTDEMADLILQVLPHDPSDREGLIAHAKWQYEVENMEYMAVHELAKGQEYLAAGDAEPAIRHFREAMQYRADHPEALTGLARALIMLEDFEAAVLVAERGVQVTARTQSAQLAVLAEAYAGAGDSNRAIQSAEEALKVLGPSEEALGESIRRSLESYRTSGR